MKFWLVFAAAFAIFLGATIGATSAAPVFVEDFEDGDANGWAPSGGDARLTQYAGNTSLRMSGRTAVVRAIDTREFAEVSVAAALAASSLESGEYCLVEASADGGSTWVQVLRVEDGQDDALTLHTSSVRDARFDNAERLLIGARIVGSTADDQCWLDNVRVAGVTTEQPAPRSALARETLLSGVPASDLVPMAAFSSSVGATAPRHVFRGTLDFNPQVAGFRLHRDLFRYDADATLQIRSLPRFNFDLIQDGDVLIPTRRGPVPSEHPSWEYALEPGRV